VVGRTQLRQCVAVEDTLAHIGQWQGNKPRYFGSRKNLFDLCRMAVVHNLHVLARMSEPTVEEGKQLGKLETIPRMLLLGLSLEVIAHILDLPMEVVQQVATQPNTSKQNPSSN